jgi:hypothetical protein
MIDSCKKDKHSQPQPQPQPQAVKLIMRKHGLAEPSARAYALLAYGESALNG